MSKPYGVRARLRSIKATLLDRIRQLAPALARDDNSQAEPARSGPRGAAEFGRELSSGLWLPSGLP